MLRIGLIGCGNIATIIAEKARNIDICAAFDADKEKMEQFASVANAKACSSLEELLDLKCDIIVEAASPAAVVGTARKVLETGTNLMVMSVGGLIDPTFRTEVCEVAKKHDAKIYVPSGAIGGMDALQAAKVGSIAKIQLVTRKPPGSLGLDVSEETTVFEGSPSEAISLFPHNINVAVTLALAGGEDTVSVRIVADPSVDKNIHSIRIEGEVGTLTFSFENEPSPNKATSLLAGFSAVALLEKLASPIQM